MTGLTHLELAKVHIREAQLWTHDARTQQILWALDEIVAYLEGQSINWVSGPRD